jgi:hypothetical protein
MNVYEMYEENGNRAGFCIVRNTWGNTVARVLSIAGQAEGPLNGRPPYFGNPVVLVDILDAKTGFLKAENQVLSCPGTSAYRLLELTGELRHVLG